MPLDLGSVKDDYKKMNRVKVILLVICIMDVNADEGKVEFPMEFTLVHPNRHLFAKGLEMLVQ